MISKQQDCEELLIIALNFVLTDKVGPATHHVFFKKYYTKTTNNTGFFFK